jgi:hypothetical protein
MAEYQSMHARRLRERMARHLIKSFEEENGLSLDDNQRLAMAWLYCTKHDQGEFDADMVEYTGRCVQEVVKSYLAQRCAFEDILTKDGYFISERVPKDFAGKIAGLSNFGTLLILGQDSGKGRLVTTRRLHTPGMDRTGKRAYLNEDLRIGYPAMMSSVVSGSKFSTSDLIALACKAGNGASDELEARTQEQHDTICGSIFDTLRNYGSLGVETLIEMNKRHKQ